MKPLQRKLWRELLHLKGQMLAVAAVVACGISVFVSMSSVKYSLEASRQRYYPESRIKRTLFSGYSQIFQEQPVSLY